MEKRMITMSTLSSVTKRTVRIRFITLVKYWKKMTRIMIMKSASYELAEKCPVNVECKEFHICHQ